MATDQEILISCRRCGRKTASRSMKFDMNGKDLICPDCYNKQHAKLPASVALNTSAKSAVGSSRTSETYNRSEAYGDEIKKVSYYCTTCNFKFSRKEGLFVKYCPNCARDTVFLVTSNKISDIMEDNFLKKRVYEEE